MYIPWNYHIFWLIYQYFSNKYQVYYSHSFYDKNFFYEQLHDGKKYFDLRKKYKANNVFPEIYDKITTKNGNLWIY